MIDVKEKDDGSFDISWDANDPKESILNTWTEQDFIDAIMNRCKEIIEQDERQNQCDTSSSGTVSA